MTQAYSEKEIPSSPNRSRTYDLYFSFPIFRKARPFFFRVFETFQTYPEEERPYLSKYWKGKIYFPDREISLALYIICSTIYCWLDPLLQDPVLLFCRGGPCKHSYWSSLRTRTSTEATCTYVKSYQFCTVIKCYFTYTQMPGCRHLFTGWRVSWRFHGLL